MEGVYTRVDVIKERRKHILYLRGVLRKVYGNNVEQMQKDARKCALLVGDLSQEKPSDIMKILLPLMLAEADSIEELQELIKEILPD